MQQRIARQHGAASAASHKRTRGDIGVAAPRLAFMAQQAISELISISAAIESSDWHAKQRIAYSARTPGASASASLKTRQQSLWRGVA
jgi:hypothetical protein